MACDPKTSNLTIVITEKLYVDHLRFYLLDNNFCEWLTMALTFAIVGFGFILENKDFLAFAMLMLKRFITFMIQSA